MDSNHYFPCNRVPNTLLKCFKFVLATLYNGVFMKSQLLICKELVFLNTGDPVQHYLFNPIPNRCDCPFSYSFKHETQPYTGAGHSFIEVSCARGSVKLGSLSNKFFETLNSSCLIVFPRLHNFPPAAL
jgi:hypothetical protein